MRGTEGVVDEKVTVGSENTSELRVVLRLSRIEARVLEEGDAPPWRVRHELLLFPTGGTVTWQVTNVVAEEFLEAGRHWGETGVLRRSLRPAEVAGEHQAGVPVEKGLEGRQGSSDTSVVGYRSAAHGHVEVDPDECFPSSNVDVVYRPQFHSSSVGRWRPMSSSTSTMRLL